jgi:hypothetical protein
MAQGDRTEAWQKKCKNCGSYAISPNLHGRKPGVDMDLCDVCYWRKRAEVISTELGAIWHISLKCNCPYCKKNVNLLDAPDFWDGKYFKVGEHMTDRTRNVQVTCPECGEEFKVDFLF